MSYDELVTSLRNQVRRNQTFGLGTHEDTGLMDRAVDAIEELQKRLSESIPKSDAEIIISEVAKSRWISVKERLPEEEESVFVVRKFLGVKGQVPPSTYTEIAYRIGDRWVADSDEYKIARHRHTDPTYWMPLPESPKEEEA